VPFHASECDFGVRSTHNVPVPPSEEVTVIWTGCTARGTTGAPRVIVPSGSSGLPDVVRSKHECAAQSAHAS
jgi:hypothetical protein